MSKLSRHDIQKLEDYWINLHEYKKQLKFREWELLNAHKESDCNIGGGRSGNISDTTALKGIVLAEDMLYQNLQRIVRTIEEMYLQLDHDLKTIVDMRYWDQENNCYEWEDIADRLYMSRNKVLRKRNALIDETARKLAWA